MLARKTRMRDRAVALARRERRGACLEEEGKDKEAEGGRYSYSFYTINIRRLEVLKNTIHVFFKSYCANDKKLIIAGDFLL